MAKRWAFACMMASVTLSILTVLLLPLVLYPKVIKQSAHHSRELAAALRPAHDKRCSGGAPKVPSAGAVLGSFRTRGSPRGHPMKSPRLVYAETSVYGRMIGSEDPRYRISWRVMHRLRRQKALVGSPLVGAEVAATGDLALRAHLRALLERFAPRRFAVVTGVVDVAENLLGGGLLNKNHLNDLLHLAYTVFWKLDVLLTWDEGELATESTRRAVVRYCRGRGQQSPRIETPEGLARWLDIKTW